MGSINYGISVGIEKQIAGCRVRGYRASPRAERYGLIGDGERQVIAAVKPDGVR